ncbi:MAG TPA: hypothetical protein VGI44_09145 [Acidimicrobiales bacterium]
MNPKTSHPTTEPAIHATFLESAIVLWGRLTTSTTIHTTNISDTAYRTSDDALEPTNAIMLPPDAMGQDYVPLAVEGSVMPSDGNVPCKHGFTDSVVELLTGY